MNLCLGHPKCPSYSSFPGSSFPLPPIKAMWPTRILRLLQGPSVLMKQMSSWKLSGPSFLLKLFRDGLSIPGSRCPLSGLKTELAVVETHLSPHMQDRFRHWVCSHLGCPEPTLWGKFWIALGFAERCGGFLATWRLHQESNSGKDKKMTSLTCVGT